ncbi:glutathione S-transferase [Limoniibacter endophyticus]|uniref:Glutathione S-transferase n=2 Tax=Limoniibacter endophyticus TaxID=1565040 RepID=A0A8J3GGZ4_9HYPH|nr:glutathione S-transferase [Limoniibacter endophyticus]
MAAKQADMDIEIVKVDANAEPALVLENNPLGKIPVLILEDGTSIFDSRAITQYLARASKNKLFPRSAEKRLEAERLEALADGLCDALLAHVYERRMRPEEKVHQPWLDKQWGKAVRALDYFNENAPALTKNPTVGIIALRAALAYTDLRFGDTKWEKGRGKLKSWRTRFDKRYPELVELLPQA